MTFIALAVFAILAAIAALHAAWGFGLRFPARDERGLVALVVGATGQNRMPEPIQCLSAAAAILAAGLVALFLADIETAPVPAEAVTLAGALTTAVFAGRGLAAFVPAWRRRFSQQPFARLDRACYGPLCLALAAAFAGLTAARI